MRHKLNRQPGRCAQPLRRAPLLARQAALDMVPAMRPAVGEEYQLPHKRVPDKPTTFRTRYVGKHGAYTCSMQIHGELKDNLS